MHSPLIWIEFLLHTAFDVVHWRIVRRWDFFESFLEWTTVVFIMVGGGGGGLGLFWMTFCDLFFNGSLLVIPWMMWLAWSIFVMVFYFADGAILHSVVDGVGICVQWFFLSLYDEKGNKSVLNRRFPEITGEDNLTVFSYSGRVKSPEWRWQRRRADLRQF